VIRGLCFGAGQKDPSCNTRNWGNRFRGFLNGALFVEASDDAYKVGRVGLWTKADSVTAFDDLVIRGVPGRTELTGRSLA